MQARSNAMQCPVDGTQLVMTDRSGVEIDYCPKCRGVWLDRGELDKIIDRAAPAAEARRPERGHEDRREAFGDRHEGKPYRKKREGFLGDLFDF
jgi:Zn-finger nucleic acid-binding protein